MQNAIAIWVTRVLNPLIIPSITMLVLVMAGGHFIADMTLKAKWMLPMMVFGCTFIIPGLIFLILLRKGLITDPEMKNRYERIVPSIITAIFFYATYYLMNRFGVHPIFSFYMLAATLLVILCLTITYFWKISLHMSAMGAMTGTFVGLSFLTASPFTLIITVSIFLSAMVAFARLRLNAHTPAQVYAGFMAGFSLLSGLFLLQTV